MKKFRIFGIIIKCNIENGLVLRFLRLTQSRKGVIYNLLKEIKIASNIKTVEQLKTELIKNISVLYEDINAEADSETNNKLINDTANIINVAFVLAKRLGLDYDDVLSCMGAKLDKAIESNNPIEKDFGDMSELRKRLKI